MIFEIDDYVRYADKENIFAKRYTSNCNRELFKINQVLKAQPPTYKLEDIHGEINERKHYQEELLKSDFEFESNNKVLELHNIILNVNKFKDDKKRFNLAKHTLSISKAHKLFLEDNDDIDMKDNDKNKIVLPPTYEKDVVNKEY